MKNVLLALAVSASLIAGCGGEPAKRSDTATVQLTAAAGGASRLIGPSSTCGHGAPPDIVLACGIRAAHPRVKALPVRPGATITLRFEAKVGRLLVQEKRATGLGLVEEINQLEPAAASSDGMRWTVRAPERVAPDTFLGLVALYEEPVRINHLGRGGTVPLDNAVIQFQLALGEPRPAGDAKASGG